MDEKVKDNARASFHAPSDLFQGIAKEQTEFVEHNISPSDTKLMEADPWKIDLSQNYPEPEYTLTYHGIGLMPLGDLSMVKAKAKSGKTFLFSVLMASVLGCNAFGFQSVTKDPMVLYFDTEQSRNDTAKVIKRDYRLLGWQTNLTNAGLIAYNCREVARSEILIGIEQRVRLKKPSHVFVDGVVDLCQNFNDPEMAQPLVRDLMRISSQYHCHICVVLHTNKGKDDDNARGHLGTELTNKCADVLSVTKKGDVINVTETECRGHKMIDDFAFSIGEDGMPYVTQTTKEVEEQERVKLVTKVMKAIFKDEPFLGKKEIGRRYQKYTADDENLKSISAQTVEKYRIDFAVKYGILEKTPSGKYRLLV